MNKLDTVLKKKSRVRLGTNPFDSHCAGLGKLLDCSLSLSLFPYKMRKIFLATCICMWFIVDQVLDTLYDKCL